MNVAPRYAFVCALALAGCNLFPGAGSRAADFIESLVEAEAPPADVSGGLAARVALDYLRALHRQGVVLDYRVVETKRRGDGKTAVRLRVERARDSDAARVPPPAAPHLGVELDRDDAGAWRVVRWWAED